MTARLLAGNAVAETVLAGVARDVAALTERGVRPGLGTVLVGDDDASAGYVRKKHEACERMGIASFDRRLPASASQQTLQETIRELNDSAAVDAFLIQHPVPPHLDYDRALASIAPDKDADGLHPLNLGRLVLQTPGPRPCTPAGILALLAHYEIPVAGREVVIVGRGPTLGRPLALMLSARTRDANAAVTVVHTGVGDLARYTRRAEILIAAAGVPGIVTPGMVAPGAVVVSGGISWQGRRLLPDVSEAVAEVAGWITPRLGGVGPTTIAMLLRNTVQAARHRTVR